MVKHTITKSNFWRENRLEWKYWAYSRIKIVQGPWLFRSKVRRITLFIYLFLRKGKLYFKATWKEQSGVHNHKLVGGRNSYMSIWQCLSGKSHQFLLITQYLLSFLFRLKLKRLTWRCPLYLCYPNTLISGWRILGVNLTEGIHLIIKYLYWEYG